MVALIAVAGLVMGMALNWLSNFLPRFSANQPDSLPVPAVTLAIWQAVRRAGRWDSRSVVHCFTELFSAFAVTILWAKFGTSWLFVFFAASYSFLMLIAVIDIKYRLILNVVIYPFTLVVLVVPGLFCGQDTLSGLLGGGIAGGVFFLTATIKPGQIGGGDIKLATLIGFFFGFPGMLWALLVGGSVGALFAVLLLAQGQSRRFAMPYAPFLCLGAMVALLVNPFMGVL